MASVTSQEIKSFLRDLYVADPRPWLVGFSGGKDSTMVASLVFDSVLSVAPDRRKKLVTTFVNQRLGHWGEAILHLGALDFFTSLVTHFVKGWMEFVRCGVKEW